MIASQINFACINTNADKVLKEMILDRADKEILSSWSKLLLKSKVEYNARYKYGLYQIEKDIDVESGRKDKTDKNVMVKKYNNSEDVDDLVKRVKSN